MDSTGRPLNRAQVVVLSDDCDPRYRWIEHCLPGHDIELQFVRCAASAITRPFNPAYLLGALRAALLARRIGASAVVAHGPTIAAWYGLVARLLRVRAPLLAHTFNFITFPSLTKRRMLSFAYRVARIQRYVVYSSMERQLYAETFGIPVQRFDVVLWGGDLRALSTPGPPAEAGDYVCAIGGNSRDYQTLLAAAARLPEIRFVAVVRPDNLRGLRVPPNVIVRTNVPFEVAMNILHYAKFMVLPLAGTEVPCGHVTIVFAMQFGKAYIITDSAGVRDYAKDQINALTVRCGSVDEVVAAVVRLWNDPQFCVRLGANGQRFATAECSLENIAHHFCDWLQKNQIGQQA
jgi:glycosyltransferase involved in cell wall biosynthesis